MPDSSSTPVSQVRRIELRTRGLVNHLFSGEYHSVFKGRGMAFSEVREYRFGDDVRSIDWNVSARFNKPFVKVFEEERELTVMLLADVSGSQRFGSGSRLKREAAAELCAILALSALKNNDKVGLLVFSDRIEKFVPPKKGRTHSLRIIREILDHRPTGTGTDIAGALQYFSNLIRKRSISFLISDFLAEDFSTPLRIAARKHDLIAVHVTDARERQLPDAGLVEVEDAETGTRLLVDTSRPALRDAYARYANQQRLALHQTFRKSNVDVIEIDTETSLIDPLVRFFHMREKRR